MDGNAIKVVCRFRPQNSIELGQNGQIVVRLDDEVTDEGDVATLHLESDGQKGTFSFDKVFDWSSTQQDVYQYAVAPIIDDLMKGYNGTVFAYGQTGSGKTFTMMGKADDDVLKGIIPRIVEDVFKHIHDAPNQIEFTVKVSYLEIYLEKIRDLLAPQNDNLPVHEDKSKGTYIKGMKEIFVSNVGEILEVMRTGDGTRAVSSTNMNEQSSRSHSLFLINIHQRNSIEGTTKSATLYLVDLAGSEKVGKTGATGQTLEEAKKINKSLTALGMVINALTDGKGGHVPYRDSKLTRILQESLGGNSKTTLIINCSPSSYNDAETMSTLRFGYRAKNIKNKAKQNLELSASQLKVLLKTAETELRQLKRKCKQVEAELARWRAGETVDAKEWTTSESRPGSSGDTEEAETPELKRSSSSQLLTEEKEDLLNKEAELLDQIQEKEHQIDQLTKKCNDLEYYEAETANLMEENKKLLLASTTQKAAFEKVDFDLKNALIRIEELEAEKQAQSTRLASPSRSIVASPTRKQRGAQEQDVPADVLLQKYQQAMPDRLIKMLDDVLPENGEQAMNKQELQAQIRARFQAPEAIQYDSPFDVPKRLADKSVAELADLLTNQSQTYEKMRHSFMEDLEDRCARVVDLQMSLDQCEHQLSRFTAGESYQPLMDRITMLEAQLEEVNTAQVDVADAYAQSQRDVQTKQRQLAAANERATNLESLIKELNENMAQQMLKLEAQVEQYQKQLQKAKPNPQFSFGDGKVAKPLRGKES